MEKHSQKLFHPKAWDADGREDINSMISIKGIFTVKKARSAFGGLFKTKYCS